MYVNYGWETVCQDKFQNGIYLPLITIYQSVPIAGQRLGSANLYSQGLVKSVRYGP